MVDRREEEKAREVECLCIFKSIKTEPEGLSPVDLSNTPSASHKGNNT